MLVSVKNTQCKHSLSDYTYSRELTAFYARYSRNSRINLHGVILTIASNKSGPVKVDLIFD